MIRVVYTASRIRMLTFYPSRIPDPGVKNAPDPGSGSATLPKTTKNKDDLTCTLFNYLCYYYLFSKIAESGLDQRQILLRVLCLQRSACQMCHV